MPHHRKRQDFRGGRVLLALAGAFALSACSALGGGSPSEGIGFREARFVEIEATKEYRACKDDALELDRQAREEGSPARYLASARLLEKCEAGLASEVAHLPKEERMRAYGLAVQNYLRGGDLAKARATLEKLREAFPESDLYYADGSSFTETMALLLSPKKRGAVGEFSVVNVDRKLKSELRRIRYWKHN